MKNNKCWAAAGRMLAAVAVTSIATLMLTTNVWAQHGGSDIPERVKTAWVTWHTWDGNNPGTVVGTIVTPTQFVTVTYTGEVDFTELENNGINYFRPKSTYSCPVVINAPSTANMIAISGTPETHTLSFSPPIKNPVIAIVSLGGGSLSVGYKFSAKPAILVQGRGKYYGGGDDRLQIVDETTLEGTEGDGLIQFTGRFGSISWTVEASEYWNGFTVGFPPVHPKN